MAARFAELVRTRAQASGLEIADSLCDALAAYLALLARWNRKINLTSFDLDAPTDAAIDRLVIEALLAAPLVRATDRVSVDIGSGGGSPALPLRLARPELEMVLVEVRERKSAFLRDAIRELQLGNVRVEAATFESCAARPEWRGYADLVTMRAVRADDGIWIGADRVLREAGRVLWFVEFGETTNFGSMFRNVAVSKPVVVLEKA